jgi:siroheme synthase
VYLVGDGPGEDAGKESGRQEQTQSEIFEQFLYKARRAGVIVRSKSGDPMVFACDGEEPAFLVANGIEAEVVPGVESALAAPALTTIPATLRGIAASFSVIAGHGQSPTKLDRSAYQRVDTLVIPVSVEHRNVIAHTLIEQVRPASQPLMFIENTSPPRECAVECPFGDVGRHRLQARIRVSEGVAA